MYRIVKESYENYKSDFLESNKEDNYRYKIMKPFEILFNLKKWEHEKSLESKKYMKVADLLNYINKNISNFPEFKVFIRELEARNIVGKNYSMLSNEEKHEIIKIFKMFLNLTYWD
ncbi:MAG: hypothetical protein ACQEQE_03175 [Bacillota bacterium]